MANKPNKTYIKTDEMGSVSITDGEEFRFTEDYRGASEGIVVQANIYHLGEGEPDENVQAENAGVALSYRGRNGEIDLLAEEVLELIKDGTLVPFTGTRTMHE